MIDLLFARGSWFIILSVILCLILTSFPLSSWLVYGRPIWMVMIVIYWVYALPGRMSIGFVWFLGLILDVTFETKFGSHAIALSLVAYLSFIFHRQIRVFSMLQQMLVVAVISTIFLLVLRLAASFVGDASPGSVFYWLPVITSALIWPWFNIILQNSQRRFYIYDARSD